MPHNIFPHEDYDNILANATKFSPQIDMERLEELVITVYSSHSGTVQIWGIKGNEPKHTPRQIDTFGYPATSLETYRIKPSFKFITIRFINDGTNTTTHEVTYAYISKKIAVLVKGKY